MKVKRPGTDQWAEFIIRVNGVASTEYVLPSAPTGDPNVIENFIEVKSGDDLAIYGRFAGSVLHGAFDLVVDGTFAGDARFGGDTIKPARMTRTFTKALNCRKPPGWTSTTPSNKLQEGYLQVKQLGPSTQAEIGRHEIEDDNVTRPGIGSIAMIVSVNQAEPDNYSIEDQEWQIGFDDWRSRSQTKVRKSGIPPDLHIGLDITEEVINSKRSSKHRQHWTDPRPGPKTWAKFIFYYRTGDRLTAAGCTPRSNDVHLLEPWDNLIDGDFVEVDKKDQAKKTKAKKASADQDDQSDADDNNARNSMFVSPAPTATKDRAKSPSVAKKKGRLGGTLTLKEDGGVSIARLPDLQEVDASLAQSMRGQNTPLVTEQSAANPSKTPSEELPDAVDDMFGDNSGLFMSTSDEDDRVSIAATGAGAFTSNTKPSSITRPYNTSTDVQMGAALSSVRTAGRSAVPAETASKANDGASNDLDQYFDDAAAGLPLIDEAPHAPSTIRNAPEAAHDEARASNSPRASTEPLSSSHAPTESGYAATPSALTRPQTTGALHPSAKRSSRTADEVGASLGSPAATIEGREPEQTHRLAISKPSHANHEAKDLPRRDGVAAVQPLQIISDTDRIPSVATIRAAIPPEGIAIGQLSNLLNSCGPFENLFTAKKHFNKRVDEVATANALGTRFYLKPSAKPAMAQEAAGGPSAPLQSIKQEVNEEDSECEITLPDERQDRAQPASRASSSTTQAHAEAPVANTPIEQTPDPAHKRPASAMSPATSAGDPPAKRSRLEELAERKAQTLQRLEAKQARNAAIKKAKEDKRKAAEREAAEKEKREAAEAAERENAKREAAEREAAEREAARIKAQEDEALRELEELERIEAEADGEFDEFDADDIDMAYEDGFGGD